MPKLRCIFTLLLRYAALLLFGSHSIFVGGTSDSLLTLDGQDLDVIVIKIGGSSLTDKARKESIDAENLNWFSSTLSSSISEAFLVPDIDEKHGECVASSSSTEDKKCTNGGGANRRHAFVVIHGAGSYGHQSAKHYGLGNQLEPPQRTNSSISLQSSTERRRIMKGITETRISVQKLNRLLVSNLAEHGVNAVGISPCFSIPEMQAHGGGETEAATLRATSGLTTVVKDSLQAGLVPVLHGDACLYGAESAGILSGDTLMEIIGKDSWVTNAIFLTDVDGVFTSDPRKNSKAELLTHIEVDKETLEILSPIFEVSGSSHDHDVTGGLKTKLGSAAAIASSGRNVTIVKCGSISAEEAIHQERSITKATVIYSSESL